MTWGFFRYLRSMTCFFRYYIDFQFFANRFPGVFLFFVNRFYGVIQFFVNSLREKSLQNWLQMPIFAAAMYKTILYYVTSFVWFGFLVCCSGQGSHDEMLQRLHQLSEFNQQDSVFTSTAEAQTLADYFDRHGSPNEQLLAHYLLGRAYADLHEAPMAIHCYQEAITRANTTAADCNLSCLSRVNGQAAAIFYQQSLHQQQLQHLQQAERYAWQAGDTLASLLFRAHQASAYENLHKPEAALQVYEDAARLLKQYHYNNVGAGFSGVIAYKLLSQGDVERAADYLRDYEQHSGFFDDEGNVEAGREIYYYWKGLYLMETQRFEAAEQYFRKELGTGLDFNSQNSGAYGLAQLFQRTHRPDSAAKYMSYAYAMNDSLYAQQATDAVEQAHAMYDYSRHQEQAREAQEQAARQRLFLWLLAVGAVALLIIGVQVFFWQRSLRRRDSLRFSQQLATYRQREQRRQQVQEDWHTRLNDEPVYRQLNVRASAGQLLTPKEWEEVEELLNRLSPHFSQFLKANSHLLSSYERQVCILTSLFVKPKPISYLIGVDNSYISKMRTAIVKKIFSGTNGKELDSLLTEICWREEPPMPKTVDEIGKIELTTF